jgi:hypothetical protein
MSVLERAMKAYVSRHDLNPKQPALVRAELSTFIGDRPANRRETTMLPEMKSATASRHPRHGTITESPAKMPEQDAWESQGTAAIYVAART